MDDKTVQHPEEIPNAALTPRERERLKSAEARGEDVAYTVNHAISCGLTDTFIQPYVNAWVSNKLANGHWPSNLQWLQRFFESHDAHGHGGHDHHHDHHDHHAHEHGAPNLKSNARHWLAGEAIGDFGAVPLTIAVQRLAPGFMTWLRYRLEPIAGHRFHAGAHRDARLWAEHRHLDPDGAEAKAKEAELYEHEISHLPNAAVWNVFSSVFNVGAQKYWLHSPMSWPNLLLSKSFGMAVSNFALLGSRAVSPETFNTIDRFNSKHIITPVTKVLVGWTGVDKKNAARIAEKESGEEARYDGRLTQPPAVAPSLG